MAKNNDIIVPWAKSRLRQFFCEHEPEWYAPRGGLYFSRSSLCQYKICKKCGKILAQRAATPHINRR